MDYKTTIRRFRAKMHEGTEYGVLYVRAGVQDYYPKLVTIDRPMELPGEWIEGELHDVCLGSETLGNAAGPASVRCAHIAKAIGALDAEDSEEAAGIS